jgi:hypothetical protein
MKKKNFWAHLTARCPASAPVLIAAIVVVVFIACYLSFIIAVVIVSHNDRSLPDYRFLCRHASKYLKMVLREN